MKKETKKSMLKKALKQKPPTKIISTYNKGKLVDTKVIGKTDKIKDGDVVRLFDTKGLSGYKCYRKLLKIKNKPMVVRRVKSSGGILLEGIILGYNIEGVEQGLLPERFIVVNPKGIKVRVGQMVETPYGKAVVKVIDRATKAVRVRHIDAKTPVTDFYIKDLKKVK